MHVGRVGSFVPVVDGAGGGVLLRKANESYTSVSGTKGYRWKESELVKTLGNEDQIDLSYYYRLVDESIKSIKNYGPLEDFVDNWKDPEVEEIYPIGFNDVPQ